MQSAQAGDARAYRQLLEEIAPFLRSMAVKVHGDRNDVEDAVQDALLSLHAGRRSHDAKRPFTPWLMTIAHRRFADRLRRQRIVRQHEIALDAEHENLAEGCADSHAQRADAATLREAVAKLPPAQREAITLTKLQEMSLDQAAQLTGSSIAALKVSTHRGVRGLQRLLGPRQSAAPHVAHRYAGFEPVAIRASDPSDATDVHELIDERPMLDAA